MHSRANRRKHSKQQTPRHQIDTSARFSYTHPISMPPIRVVAPCAIATRMRIGLLLGMQLLTPPLYVPLCVCPFVCMALPCVCPSVYVSLCVYPSYVCPSVYISPHVCIPSCACLFRVYLSRVYSSVCMSPPRVRPSVCVSLCMCILQVYVPQCVYPFVCMSLRAFVSSVCMSLRVHVPPCLYPFVYMALLYGCPFRVYPSYVSECMSLRMYVPSVCMTIQCVCLSCICSSCLVYVFPCVCPLRRYDHSVRMSTRVYVLHALCMSFPCVCPLHMYICTYIHFTVCIIFEPF